LGKSKYKRSLWITGKHKDSFSFESY
jgi:hypothetical protein